MPWEVGPSKKRPYARTLSPEAITDAAESIKIVSEKEEGDPEFRQAFDLLIDAQRIVLLGFGYLEDNIRNLHLASAITYSPHPNSSTYREVLGSALGLKTAQQATAERKVGGQIRLGDEYEDALTFLRRYVDFDSIGS